MTPRTELTAPQGSGLVRGQRVTAAMRRDRVHRTIPVMPPALLWISMHCSFLQEGRNPGPVRNVSEPWLMQGSLPSPGGPQGGCGLEGLLDPHPTSLQFL